MVANGLSSLEKIGLLRVHSKSSLCPSANPGTAQFFRHAIPVDRAAADAWEHASACERIFRAFFTRAFKILSRIQDRELLLKFLGGIPNTAAFILFNLQFKAQIKQLGVIRRCKDSNTTCFIENSGYLNLDCA